MKVFKKKQMLKIERIRPVITQIIKKFKMPKYIWFIALRYAGLEYYFSLEVITKKDAFEILKGVALAGNYKLFVPLFAEFNKFPLSYFEENYRKNTKPEFQKDSVIYPHKMCMFGEIFKNACQSGNSRIIKLFKEPDNDEGMVGAFLGGHYDLAKKFIKKGACIDDMFRYVCLEGELQYVEGAFKCVEKYPNIDIDYMIYSSFVDVCETNRLDVIKFLVNKGALKKNTSENHLRSVVDSSNKLVADYLIEYDKDYLDMLMYASIEFENIEMVKYFYEKGYNDLVSCLEVSIEYENKEAEEFFKSMM